MSGMLSAGDFQAFFSELWTAEDRSTEWARPFPWQQRLVEAVADSGRWPDLLDLPTGSGKTTAVDIAVFLMALRDDMPRRIVFVVDRRVVVDQAAQRARRLAELLEQPGDRPTVAAVRERLHRLAARPLGTEPAVPLVAAELRGGIARDTSWALRPDVPAVLTSTVDQVGSRLLFRGYGVRPGMLPIHAGLLANDCLFLLDEVHLSQPFAQTLAAVRARYRPPAGVLPDRWQMVNLSATAGAGADARRRGVGTFNLGADDLDPEVAPVLVRRLIAPKPARIRLVKVKKSADDGQGRRALTEACVTATGELLEKDHIRTVAVVVNRVATAQAVHAALLQSWHGEGNGDEVVLLTGRMRPFDRDDLLDSHWHRLAMGRSRDAGQPRLVVVATQAIEAGADLDVDGLVTECASLDALRQRFGRVDRAGELAATGHPSASVIVATSAGTTDEDPVYGKALGATWRWLSSLGSDLDFGIQALRPPEGDDLVGLLAPRRDAPMLFPMHLDRWSQTSPVPSTDPDVALWLHGIGDVDRDVQVIWRADLGGELLEDLPDDAVRLVSACPPGSGEALGVSLPAARRWLMEQAEGSGQAAPSLVVDVSDVEGAREANADGAREADVPIADCAPFVRWRGDRSEVLRSFRGVVAGDTIVVPSWYGGIAFGCWDPTSGAPVTDLGLRSTFVQRLSPTLRLVPQLAPSLPPPPTAQMIEEVDADPDEAIELWIRDALKRMAEEETPDRWFTKAAELLADKRKRRVQQLPMLVREADGEGRVAEAFVVTATHPFRPDRHQVGTDVSVELDPETSSFVGHRIGLHRHLDDVGAWAGAVGEACGLSETLVGDIALAGQLHDAGKADPRFQASLWWPDRRPVGLDGELLAKSATSPSDHRRREEARRESGYPQGARHELLSVALLEGGGESLRARATDWELVLHLIASHHGHARPFVPVAIDPAPTQVGFTSDGCELRARTDHGLGRLDSGIAHRYWTLVRRYGWFGLAWLEALLRLADHRASEMEETAETPGQGS